MRRKVLNTIAALTIAVPAMVSAGCGADASARGASLYEGCVQCHGEAGEGNAAIRVPAIAGLAPWYVTAQLERFASGIRGAHPEDVDGLRMRALARQIDTPEQIAALATYVSSLPRVHNPATLHGADPAAGQKVYALCVPCHGDRGQGNEQVKSPPIAGMDDWYVAQQIRNFKAGIRGRAPGDTVGMTMHAISQAVQPETIPHVAAYVHDLRK